MDVQQKIVTAAIAIVLIFVVNSAMAYGVKHGYQAPVGGNGFSEAYAQENDIHGDSYSPDHMDGGGDSVDNYEEEWNNAY